MRTHAEAVNDQFDPQAQAYLIRSLQLNAPPEVQQALDLQPDGTFRLQTGLFWARRVD